MSIIKYKKRAHALADIECRNKEEHSARGAKIYKTIKAIRASLGQKLPDLGKWKSFTHLSLSSKLDDYTPDEETSIRYLFWLALYWEQLVEVGQAPDPFDVKYFRVHEVFGKFLCECPDISFTGDLAMPPIRLEENFESGDAIGEDTLEYKATYQESSYRLLNTVPHWYEDIADKYKNKEDWEYGLDPWAGCDPWEGCDPWHDIERNLLPQEEIIRRAEEADKKFRKAMMEKYEQRQ